VGRAIDVALPHELNPKAQWDLLRGFSLQLRDKYERPIEIGEAGHPES
jgi:hypothetical protein